MKDSPSVSDDDSEEHEDSINEINEESYHSDSDLGDSDSGDSDPGDSDSDDIDPDDNGWLWLSSCRSVTPKDARTMGLRAGPHRLAIKYTDTRKDCSKIVLMEPKAFQYFLKKQKDMESEKAASNDKDNGIKENSKSEEKSMMASPQQQAQPVNPSPQQKVQIVRSADGKIKVRGLLPGQHLVLRPDGKLQLFSQSNTTQQQQQPQPQQKAATNDKDNGTNKNSKSNSETDSNIGIDKKKLEQALKHARLESQVPTPDMFKEVVDVSAELSNQTRVLYPKVAKKARCLDDFLARRIQLKTLEEKRIELKLGKISNHVQPDSKTPVVANDKTEEMKKLEEESDTKTGVTKQGNEAEDDDLSPKIDVIASKKRKREM